MRRAQIGGDDVHFFESPRPDLLRAITGIEAEPTGDHVRLDLHTNVRSAQRIAVSEFGAQIVVGFWPAELKSQAQFLYTSGRALAMLATARAHGWGVWPSPQIAFYTSPPSMRLYLAVPATAEEYAQRWEGSDARWIGQHQPEGVRVTLWAWLKRRGYANDEDDRVLDAFLAILGRRPAHFRPSLRLRKHWSTSSTEPVLISREINRILDAAGDARLPA